MTVRGRQLEARGVWRDLAMGLFQKNVTNADTTNQGAPDPQDMSTRRERKLPQLHMQTKVKQESPVSQSKKESAELENLKTRRLVAFGTSGWG